MLFNKKKKIEFNNRKKIASWVSSSMESKLTTWNLRRCNETIVIKVVQRWFIKKIIYNVKLESILYKDEIGRNNLDKKSLYDNIFLFNIGTNWGRNFNH